MKRSFPLRVDRLEDRCVLSADPLIPVIDSFPAEPEPPIVEETFVIDPYLIDPNAPTTPTKPVDPTTPDSPWIVPDQSVVPPVGDPFWAVSVEVTPTEDVTTFVIDPYLIDPNAPTTPTEPVEPTIPDSLWAGPDEVAPPVGDPFWAVSVEVTPIEDVTTFVIDPYLIDPNAPTTPTEPVEPTIPDSLWAGPEEAAQPVGDPFWAVSVEVTPIEDVTTFVIDPYLIDPNAPTTPTEPVEPTIPDSLWAGPEEVAPPVGDPFWAV